MVLVNDDASPLLLFDLTFVSVDIVDVPGATGDYSSNFEAKGMKAVETLFRDDYDFGFVHIKAVDDAGHDRNPQLKVSLLERFDHALKSILETLQELKNEPVEIFPCLFIWQLPT